MEEQERIKLREKNDLYGLDSTTQILQKDHNNAARIQIQLRVIMPLSWE